MSVSEPSVPNERVERMRPVETSPGVKVYRTGSITTRLVTEGTNNTASSASNASTGSRHRGDSKP
jgi:hypothetical protein